MEYDHLNLKEFWEENDFCLKNFDKKTRIPVTMGFDDHFLMELVGPYSTLQYYNDYNFRLQIHKKANEILEREIGRKFYSEDEIEAPHPVRFEVVMGAELKITEGATPWLESNVQTIDDVKRIIENAYKIDMEKRVLNEELLKRKKDYEEKTGKKVSWGGFTRGPATIGTSVIGTTNLCIFMMEEEEVIDEFYSIMGDKLVEYIRCVRNASGNYENGIGLADDDSFLFSPALYRKFCAPVLKKLFAAFAPNENDRRFQHSDSNMAHIMPILNELGVNGTNFGPEIHPMKIREAMPKARINGQIPPFILRNGTYDEILAIVHRDMEVAKIDGNFIASPAGSVAAGTPLKNIKFYMWAIDKYGRF